MMENRMEDQMGNQVEHKMHIIQGYTGCLLPGNKGLLLVT